jgi:hypothetical protein
MPLRRLAPIVAGFAASLCIAPSVHAASIVSLPEPGSLVLLSLGVAGLLIGRRASRKPPRD